MWWINNFLGIFNQLGSVANLAFVKEISENLAGFTINRRAEFVAVFK